MKFGILYLINILEEISYEGESEEHFDEGL